MFFETLMEWKTIKEVLSCNRTSEQNHVEYLGYIDQTIIEDNSERQSDFDDV